MSGPTEGEPPFDLSFEAVLAQERAFIGSRFTESSGAARPARVGLALSGGGIRSATFSLGFLQALSRQGLLRPVDYLSTVSGGSYVGAFLCSLFVDRDARGDPGAQTADRPGFDPDRPLQSPLGIEAVRRLRDMGRYLTPSGTSDAIYAAAIVLRNWLAIQFALGMLALLAFCSLHAVDVLLFAAPGKTPAVSPSLSLLASGMACLATASGIGYWLTRRDVVDRRRLVRIFGNLFFWAVVVAAGACAMVAAHPSVDPFLVATNRRGFLVAAVTLGGSVLLYLAAEAGYGGVPSRDAVHETCVAAEDRVRTALSKAMAWALKGFAALVALGVADWLGGRFIMSIGALRGLADAQAIDWWGLLRNAWPTLVAVVPPVVSFAASRSLKSRVPPTDPGDADTRRNWMPAVLVASGVLVVVCWLILLSAMALELQRVVRPEWQGWGLLLLAIENAGQAVCFSFLNLSSLSTFYAARLRRAYIGASSWGNPFTSVRADDPEDVIPVDQYFRSAIGRGAPLHLVNVTVAETIAAGSNLVARDRKGKPLQLGPTGVTVEGDRPGLMVRVDPARIEHLPLANWIAVSGAAVSAAIGSGTSLGTSILATLSNVRLGYWWKVSLPGADAAASGMRDAAARPKGNRTDRSGRRLLRMLGASARAIRARLRDTVQSYLVQELQGAFDGDRRRRWYLTDGGHFENTGIYALLQRRVPFIVACDNGADPGYRMEDVVRLIGRSRSDLGCELRFLGQDELGERLGLRSPLREWIGPFKDLAKRGGGQAGGPIAALAEIRYPDGPPGLLLLIKPRLTGSEPPDVLAYRARPGCGAFPQQTTGDQFFDEEQWEAYRRLGELSCERLFPAKRPEDAPWMPRDEMVGPRPTGGEARRSAKVANEGKATDVRRPRPSWRSKLLAAFVRAR